MSKFNKLFKTIMEEITVNPELVQFWKDNDPEEAKRFYSKNWGRIDTMTPEERAEFDRAYELHDKRMESDNNSQFFRDNVGLHQMEMGFDEEHPECECYKCNTCRFKYCVGNTEFDERKDFGILNELPQSELKQFYHVKEKHDELMKANPTVHHMECTTENGVRTCKCSCGFGYKAGSITGYRSF